MATFVDVAGADYPNILKSKQIQPMEGTSLLQSFHKDVNEPRHIMWEHFQNRAIRQGKWKLVALRNKPWELYNMETDRSELNDLSKKYPEKAKELADLWEKEARRTKIYPRPVPSKKKH